MATKDLHPELERAFKAIGEHHITCLGTVTDRFVNESVMLTRELENPFDDTRVTVKVRELITMHFENINQITKDHIVNEMVTVIVSRRERLVRR